VQSVQLVVHQAIARDHPFDQLVGYLRSGVQKGQGLHPFG
jgi:hypothetical protein